MDEPTTSDVTDEKIREIILREFGREQEEMEKFLFKLQEQIHNTQKQIKLLKYVQACKYYHGDAAPIDINIELALHPCVQSLLPSKKPEVKIKPEVNPSIVAPEETKEDKLPQLKTTSDQVALVRGKYKIRHTLVIGNVSQFIPLDMREDEATHKWMMYIRDKGRDDDIGKLIKKIRYFLHESYKPHDIIDVTTPPFYLTRRGWGEFPVRVIIFFHHAGNKALDFIHPLRLDESCSGMQTLGSETVLEVELFHDNISEYLASDSQESEVESVTTNQTIDEQIKREHDYCSNKPRSQRVKSENKPVFQPKHIISNSKQTHTYFDEGAVFQEYNEKKHGDVVEWYTNNLLKRVSNIYFLTTEACVKWFLTRWPIITIYASNPLYKRVHPYAFNTVASFLNSSSGKRHASEWFRAYQINKYMTDLNLQLWTTKQIYLYARMHGYVMCLGKTYFSKGKGYSNISTYTNVVDTEHDMRAIDPAPVEEVDVECVDVCKVKCSPSPKKKSPLRLLHVSHAESYVEVVTKQTGIKCGFEEIVPGIETNAASQILCNSLTLFLNDLLRKSLCNAWLRTNCRNPGSILVDDVLKTIVETPEFDILTNCGLGSENGLGFNGFKEDKAEKEFVKEVREKHY